MPRHLFATLRLRNRPNLLAALLFLAATVSALRYGFAAKLDTLPPNPSQPKAAAGKPVPFTAQGRSSAGTKQDLSPACSHSGWCWRNPLPSGNWLNGIWGSAANNIWAVGEGGTVLKWDGSAWAKWPSGTEHWLIGIWGSDAKNVWAVGESGTIL